MTVLYYSLILKSLQDNQSINNYFIY